MSLRLLVDENIPGVEQMADAGVDVLRFHGRHLCRSDLLDADAVLVRSITRVDERLLQGTAVRFVGTATSGYDHIDRGYLDAAGIAYAHAPGANANSVVEYVLAAVSACGDSLEKLLSGGCMGIVGQGHVGRLLAQRCAALGIRTREYDPWLEPSTLANPTSLSEVLRCDVVSLHCSLGTQPPHPSRHLLGERELALLAPNAVLINASRGAVIHNNALRGFLAHRDDVQVVLDVWENEPDIDTTLLQRVTFGTAHIAGYSFDGKLLATQILLRALDEALTASGNTAGHTHMAASRRFSASNAVIAPPAPRFVSNMARPEALRALLGQRYLIQDDDQQLRAAMADAAPTARAAAFDALRATYRPRRELWGSLVNVTNPSVDDLALLDALGCQVQV